MGSFRQIWRCTSPLRPDETLPELIATTHDSAKLKEAFRQTTYWDEHDWKVFETGTARVGEIVEGAAARGLCGILGTDGAAQD